MRIAVTGANGMLGRALLGVLSSHTVLPLPRSELDFTSLDSTRRVLARFHPDWVIHAGAFTAVDEAESRSLEAFRVNALGTRNVALAAAECGSRILYYSTDYVFDGQQQRPYREWDPPHPLNVYGSSKLAGELFVRQLSERHLIVRTSWLFGPGGPHFVDRILERAAGQSTLRVVEDQRGSPTFAPDLAHMSLLLMLGERAGTYHVTNSGECSWYEFARHILRLRGSSTQVEPVASGAWPQSALRPANSVLENLMLELEGTPLLRPWTSALEAYLNG